MKPHYFSNVYLLINNSLPKHKQILVCNQQKIIFYTICFPISCGFTVVLFFYNQFFKSKSDILENFHSIKRQWEHITFLSCIAHKYSTKFIFFQDTVALCSYLFHFFKKIFHSELRQIPVYAIAIFNYIGIERVGANQVNSFIRNKI